MESGDTKDMTDTNSIINRHMARILSDLEDAGCPALYKDAVKAEFVWLRSDLTTLGDDSNGNHTNGNC